MNLSDYEKRPDFKKRAHRAELELRTALATGETFDASKMIRTLDVPLNVGMQWLGATVARIAPGERITLSVKDSSS